ncbi:MAG: peptidylprolyl isomerase [Bacteroidota bacterium]
MKFTQNIFFVIAFVLLNGGEIFPQNVAEFGHHIITLEQFKTAYLDIIKKPNVYDSKELREEFLNELIASKILAEEAAKSGYNENLLLEYKIDAYKNKCLRDAHYETVIKPKISISEADVENAYLFTQEERRISQLFVKTKEEADSLYKQLKQGKTFNELAKVIFADTALANNSGDLGWVYWDQLDYDLADAAFKLPLNKISEPVKSIFGYHIIKVTDFKKKPLITRREYEVHRKKAKYLLEYKIGEKYSYEYIDAMLKSADIIIYPEVMKLVDEKLSDKFKRKPTDVDQMYELQLRDEEVKVVETNLWDYRDQIMAMINGEKLTVGDFIGLLNFVGYDVIYSGFKNTFDYTVRDFLLTSEAKKLSLESDEKVKMKTNLYREFLLQLEFRKSLIENVNVSEEEIQKLYDESKSKFNGASFEQMKEILKGFITNQKRRDVVPKYVNSILNSYVIKKDLQLIHDYYDSILKGNTINSR